jgi:hypothetical protein
MRILEMQKCPICGMMRCADHKADKKDHLCAICHHVPCVCQDEQEEAEYKGKKISVGKHKSDTNSRFDPDELAMGIEDERKHTNDDEHIARNIAKDHLIQFPKYYSNQRKKNIAESLMTFTQWLNNDKQ